MLTNFYELERRMQDEMERTRVGAARQQRIDQAREKAPQEGNWFPWRARRRARIWAGR